VRLHRRAVPQGWSAGAERRPALRAHGRAGGQDAAGPARRPALSRHTARLPHDAAHECSRGTGARNRIAQLCAAKLCAAMTPNGAVIFAIVVVAGATWSGRIAGLIVLLALCTIFGAIEIKARLFRAFAWPAAIVAPLALFMAVVWIGVVGRSPAE